VFQAYASPQRRGEYKDNLCKNGQEWDRFVYRGDEQRGPKGVEGWPTVSDENGRTTGGGLKKTLMDRDVSAY